MTIWKYPIDLRLNGEVKAFDIPKGGRVLSVGPEPSNPNNGSLICIWVFVDPNAEKEKRVFRVFGTGHPISLFNRFIGTVVIQPFAWHVFEVDA